MENTDHFSFYKNKLVEYHTHVNSQDMLARGFNLIEDQQKLREIVDGLRKSFPKEPTPGDVYTMHFAYAEIDKDCLRENDRKEWWKYAKKFVDCCPKDDMHAKRILSVLLHLPETEASTTQKFNCAKKALELISKTNPFYRDGKKLVEKIARTDYDFLLNKAKKETDYLKQIRAFDRALMRITDIPAGDRYRVFYDCINEMAPIYQKTDWGRVELPHKRKVVSDRIFKSLPLEVKTIIRNRKNLKDWWSK